MNRQRGNGAMIATVVLGLVTGAAGAASVIVGGEVRLKSVRPPAWIERYAGLRPQLEDVPRLGFWGSKRDFYRAQYVLAPRVLEVVEANQRRPPPLAVLVDTADAAERDAALEWLGGAARRRGGSAHGRSLGPGFLLVDLAPNLEDSCRRSRSRSRS